MKNSITITGGSSDKIRQPDSQLGDLGPILYLSLKKQEKAYHFWNLAKKTAANCPGCCQESMLTQRYHTKIFVGCQLKSRDWNNMWLVGCSEIRLSSSALVLSRANNIILLLFQALCRSKNIMRYWEIWGKET